jgi:hypothetical protein
MSNYHALLVKKENNQVMLSHGHYDMVKLEEIMSGQLTLHPDCYVLYNEEARAFSWSREYERLTASTRWMIDVAIPELPTVEERKQYRVDKLVSVAKARIMKAGFTTVCGRCGGTGHYSYNQIDGTRCYGCGGRKVAMVKLTKEVKKKIESHFAGVGVGQSQYNQGA